MRTLGYVIEVGPSSDEGEICVLIYERNPDGTPGESVPIDNKGYKEFLQVGPAPEVFAKVAKALS